jgi:hypothetical protein
MARYKIKQTSGKQVSVGKVDAQSVFKKMEKESPVSDMSQALSFEEFFR